MIRSVSVFVFSFLGYLLSFVLMKSITQMSLVSRNRSHLLVFFFISYRLLWLILWTFWSKQTYPSSCLSLWLTTWKNTKSTWIKVMFFSLQNPAAHCSQEYNNPHQLDSLWALYKCHNLFSSLRKLGQMPLWNASDSCWFSQDQKTLKVTLSVLHCSERKRGKVDYTTDNNHLSELRIECFTINAVILRLCVFFLHCVLDVHGLERDASKREVTGM